MASPSAPDTSPDTAPDAAPDAALRRIVANCRDDLLKYRAIALASRRPIGIHQTRVALRRLRAAFGTFREAAAGAIGRRELKALSAEAKWLAGERAPGRPQGRAALGEEPSRARARGALECALLDVRGRALRLRRPVAGKRR